MISFGAQSMTSPLRHVLVKEPGKAFASAFDSADHGYLHPVDAVAAAAEHARLVELLEDLGVTVHRLAEEHASPDLVYQYDPSLVTDDGAILLRSGKESRQGEEDLQEAWYRSHGIPVVGRIEDPGTVDGGDVFWLRPDVVCVGHSLRTNRAGIEQLSRILGGTVHVFDVPYDAGPAECLHLLSVISPIADDLAVVELERLPAGLYELLTEFGVRMIPIPRDEVHSLACNVLAVRPGVIVMLDGNHVTQRELERHGVEIHTFSGREICLNGSGGPTCLTRPVHRA